MKEGLVAFQIPVYGIEQGVHSYHFHCGDSFFASFEKSLIENGEFEVDMSLEKKSDTIELAFSIHGNIMTNCDRCTARIQLPIKGDAELMLKYAEHEKEEDEIVFISRDRDTYDVSEFLHQSIELLLPMSNTYDCENDNPRPCDDRVLEVLNEQSKKTKTKEEENPLWDQLKNLNLDH